MPVLFVLENDPERVSAMQDALLSEMPSVETTYIDNVPDAIMWLSKNLHTVDLISVDHDLGAEGTQDGQPFDPGSGRDIANYLAARTPKCPVIIHTDNFFVRPTMQAALDAGNWDHTYVAPGNGTAWVLRKWIPKVKTALATSLETGSSDRSGNGP